MWSRFTVRVVFTLVHVQTPNLGSSNQSLSFQNEEHAFHFLHKNEQATPASLQTLDKLVSFAFGATTIVNAFKNKIKMMNKGFAFSTTLMNKPYDNVLYRGQNEHFEFSRLLMSKVTVSGNCGTEKLSS